MTSNLTDPFDRNGYADHRPRKRPRTLSKDPVELWWDAMRSDEMVGNGLPVLRYPSSAHASGEVSQEPTPAVPPLPIKPKKRKKVRPPSTNTLLYHMNGNIRTMRKVRSVYTKFAALNINNEDGTGPTQPHEFLPPPAEDVEEVIDDRPWRISGTEGEVGEQNADDCMHWMGSKVLEHAGFQGLSRIVLSCIAWTYLGDVIGASKVAMDVLAGVTSDYLFNVGRTIRYLSDKYGNKMSAEVSQHDLTRFLLIIKESR